MRLRKKYEIYTDSGIPLNGGTNFQMIPLGDPGEWVLIHKDELIEYIYIVSPNEKEHYVRKPGMNRL